MDDPSYDAVHREFESLVSDVDTPEEGDAKGGQRPFILTERVAPGAEVQVGTRARFLMTSVTDGHITAYGWRDDLRVVGTAEETPDLSEPGLLLQEERDFYNDRDEGIVTAGISRVWVSRLIVAPEELDQPDAWLRTVVADPNKSVLEALQPVARHPHLVGARVVLDRGHGTYVPDLRAVAPVRLALSGNLVVPVVTERDWYAWSQRTYGPTDRPVQALASDRLWVE